MSNVYDVQFVHTFVIIDLHFVYNVHVLLGSSLYFDKYISLDEFVDFYFSAFYDLIRSLSLALY